MSYEVACEILEELIVHCEVKINRFGSMIMSERGLGERGGWDLWAETIEFLNESGWNIIHINSLFDNVTSHLDVVIL